MSRRDHTLPIVFLFTSLLILCFTIFFSSCFYGSCLSMPLRPDLVDSLQAIGRLEEEGRFMREAYENGVNRPPELRSLFTNDFPDARSENEAGGTAKPINAVVILVDFSDKVANPTLYPSSHYTDLLFSTRTYPTGSMRDFYTENSYGKLAVGGTVTIWLLMPQTYAYYVNGQRGLGVYPKNAQRLTADAVLAADPYINFSQFDNDGPDGIPSSGDDDGYVDALFVVHVGPGYEETLNPNDIHSHQWNTRTAISVDGVKVYAYAMEPENGKIGVFSHEFGHLLGLPDLYDYDYDARGVGIWSVMAYGSWGDGGLSPSHLDAWSKYKLGFSTPQAITANTDSLKIPNAETTPFSYILWTNGIFSNEYFLVENRRPVLFDSSLAGGGLLIYHIDEDVLNNRNQCCVWCSPHYLVAVKQADAQCDLECNHNSGDAGDPFPGFGSPMNPNNAFNSTSTPDSKSYAANETQVALTNITDLGDSVMVDAVVETAPAIAVSGELVDDSTYAGSGDSDGILDPGEAVNLACALNNYGVDGQNVSAGIHTADSYVTMLCDTSSYGSISSDESKFPEIPFRISVSPNCPVPHGIIFDMNISSDPGYTTTRRCVVGVRDTLRFFDWTHSSGRRFYKDQWHISTERSHTAGDQTSWKCGSQILDNYANRVDASLYTITFGITSGTELRFWHWIEAETYSASQAWDGGVVEISLNGGAWQVITPVGGYPYTIKGSPDSPFAAGTPCYSGISVVWTYQRFILPSSPGPARIRFRFGTDAATVYRGWYIDDVSLVNAEVISTPLPVTLEVSSELVAAYPNPFNPITKIKFTAGRDNCPVKISVFDITGRLVRRLVDETVPLGPHEVTWDGKDRRGRQVSSGTYLCHMESGNTHQSIKLVVLR